MQLSALIAEHGDQEWIPLDHMFFLSVDDLDLLVECVRQGYGTLASTLHTAVEADRAPDTKRFVFREHLTERYPDAGLPEYLQAESHFMRERATSHIVDR